MARTALQNWHNLAQRSLDMDSARQIRALKKEGMTYAELSEIYSLSKTTLSKIVNNEMYKEES